jgi:hypothetical protein
MATVYLKGAAQVTLTASDNLSGVTAKYYRIDGGATQTYAATFSVSGDVITQLITGVLTEQGMSAECPRYW